MPEFILDTSGVVVGSLGQPTVQINRTWRDLDAFTQGYIEALFASGGRYGWNWANGVQSRRYGFSDLAPEALALILKDCAAFVELFGLCEFERPDTCGAVFWEQRQSGDWTLDPYRAAFPPLTVSLGDDGKVYVR